MFAGVFGLLIIPLIFWKYKITLFSKKLSFSISSFQMSTKKGVPITLERSRKMRPPSLHSARVGAYMRHGACAHVYTHAHKRSHQRTNDSALLSLLTFACVRTNAQKDTPASVGCGVLVYTQPQITRTQLHSGGIIS